MTQYFCYIALKYFRDRDRSGTRSENGFILGAGRCSSPSKENLDPDECSWSRGGQRPRRTARSCSGGRYRDTAFADEATAKTYITIGPGKPTRIREHSPSKSAKLACDESVTSARERSALSRNSSPLKVFDLNRSSSPSPQRKTRANNSRDNEFTGRSSEKKELFRDTSPLKSTNILKTFRASKSDIFHEVENENKKKTQPFTTEKTFLINQTKNNNNKNTHNKERRLSIEILNTCHRVNEKNRASPESDSSSSTLSSSFSSPLSSSSESFHQSSDKEKVSNDKLSQRRISLEQRLNARTRINSPERHVTVTRKISETKTTPNGTTTTTCSKESTFVYRKASTCANLFASKIPEDSIISDNCKLNEFTNLRKPVPASRKISLQVGGQRKPLPTPRRKSLNNLISPQDRLDFIDLLECLLTATRVAWVKVVVTPEWASLAIVPPIINSMILLLMPLHGQLLLTNIITILTDIHPTKLTWLKTHIKIIITQVSVRLKAQICCRQLLCLKWPN